MLFCKYKYKYNCGSSRPIPQHHTHFVPAPTAQPTTACLNAQPTLALEWPRKGWWFHILPKRLQVFLINFKKKMFLLKRKKLNKNHLFINTSMHVH